MHINEKMFAYLFEHLEALDNAACELFLKVPAGCFKDMAEVNRRIRYIKHAVLESQDCPHCKLAGLVPETPDKITKHDDGSITVEWEEL